MPVKRTPSDASRVKVQVLLRDSTSISPACSDEKRCCELSGTNLTLFASLSTAAARARQKSTSSPVQRPWLSAFEKPGPDVLTPHTSCPRALIASSVLPAWAGTRIDAMASAAGIEYFISMGDAFGGVDGTMSV